MRHRFHSGGRGRERGPTIGRLERERYEKRRGRRKKSQKKEHSRRFKQIENLYFGGKQNVSSNIGKRQTF